MNIKRHLLLLIAVCVVQQGFSQESVGEAPLSFINSSIFSTAKEGIIPVFLPELNNELEKQRADSISTSACSDCKNQYYGRGIDVSINLKTQGNFLNIGDSGKLWLLQIESSTAYGMQFYFDKFKLPDGARLYIFNNDKTMLLGGYTSNNNPKDETKTIQFGTEYIDGKNIFLEYYEPNNPEFEGEISIINIIHAFEKSGPFIYNGGSQYCEINVACPLGNGWEVESSSVALIIGYNSLNELQGYASGVLLNNTEQDGRPYFLTARHVLDGNPLNLYDPATWHFLFNHQAGSCNSDGSNISPSMYGSVYGALIRSSDDAGPPTSDYLLLELNTSKDVLKMYGACYSGWTLNPNPQGPFTGIHHPKGDVKKISRSPYPTVQSTSWFSEIINPNANHWKVKWNNSDPATNGVTEGGSSGSPLFDINHRVIGLLHGGKSHCAGHWIGSNFVGPEEPDWYGKFSSSWQQGDGFAFWLDPYGTGATTIGSYCNPGTVAGTGTYPSPGTNLCYTHLSQDGFYINNKLDLVTEVCPASGIIIKAISPNPALCPNGYFNLTLYNKIFISVTLCNANLVPIDVEYFKWVNPGNSISFNLINNMPSPYIGFVTGQTYRVKVATNRWGWEEYTKYIHIASDVRNINNSNIVSDVYGKYITISNSTVTQPIDVVARDNIRILPNSTLYAGHYRIDASFDCSDFMGIDQNTDDNLFRMTNNTIELESNDKALSEVSQSNTGFSVYPNPNKGQFTIELTSTDAESTIEIYDVMGKKVWSKISSANKLEIDISGQPKGIYLVKVVNETKVIVQKIVYD